MQARPRAPDTLLLLPTLAEELDGIKNIQLKTFLVSSLLTKEQHGVGAADAAALVSLLIGRCQQQHHPQEEEKKNVPLEQKLYLKKLLKLRQLIELFQELEKVPPAPPPPGRLVIGSTGSDEAVAQLSCQLSARRDHLETLLQMIKEEEEPGTLASQPFQLTLADFLLCFELEGELQTCDR